MRKFVGAIVALALCMAICSCSTSLQSSDTAVPSENVSDTAEPTEESTPIPTADLTLNADGTLDGMEYKYNSSWIETSDPLTNATLRTYEVNLGSDGTIQLRLEAVKDESTSTAVHNLRTQNDADREAVINSMLTAKEGTLTNASSERAVTPPSGTRAMWSYQGTTGNQSVHGYSYVGGSQLYEVSVTGGDTAYAAFEPTWKSLVNQLKFQEIAPIETPSPTPEPTPEPTPKPAPVPTFQGVDPEDEIALTNYLLTHEFTDASGNVLTFKRNEGYPGYLDSFLNGQLDYQGWSYGYHGFAGYVVEYGEGADRGHLGLSANEDGIVNYITDTALFYPR